MGIQPSPLDHHQANCWLDLMKTRRNLLIAGAAALATGVLVYLADRPASDVYLLPDVLAALQEAPGGVDDSLPSFLHALAFSLFLAATGTLSTLATARLCAGWWVVEALLEAAQHPSLATALSALLPGWATALPLLEALPEYLLRGTFDPRDIMFAGLGCLCAFALTQSHIRLRERYA